MSQKQKVSFKYKGKKISFTGKKVGFFSRGVGLMFSRRENAEILVFDFKKPTLASIHSFFVFFPFVAVWIDEKGKVIETKNVKSFSFSVYPRRKFTRLVEIPLNKKHSSLTRIFPDGS